MAKPFPLVATPSEGEAPSFAFPVEVFGLDAGGAELPGNLATVLASGPTGEPAPSGSAWALTASVEEGDVVFAWTQVADENTAA